MAVVFSEIGSDWDLKKLFSEETEKEKKAAEEHPAAAKAKEPASSKVSYEGVRQLYPCLCYPKELLKKEDEERYGPQYEELLPKVFKLWAIKQRYNKEVLSKMLNEWPIIRRYVEEVELRKMFIEWVTKHGKRYDGVYEWRLRYKIWLRFKERMEQICSKSGRTFSMKEMTRAADLTVIEHERGNRGRVRPSEHPLSDVRTIISDMMGESWIEKEREGFDEWAKRHKRDYSSTEEREERFIAYLDNMKGIQLSDKLCPGEWGHGNDLENMDKFPWEADLIPDVKCSRCRPCEQPSDSGQTSLMNQMSMAAGKTVAKPKGRAKPSVSDGMRRMLYTRMEKTACSNSGQTSSMNQMSMAAHKTVTNRKGRVKPDKIPLRDVKKKILNTMGESWMKEMAKEFEKWAERHEKVYSSTEERQKRRLAYLENMREIDVKEKEHPGQWKYGNDLENMDKFAWEAELIPAT